MNEATYQEYLQTEHWLHMRTLALTAAKDHCSLCRESQNLQVHHNTYERLGSELLDDLVVLCGDCHKRMHDILPGTDEDLPDRVEAAINSARGDRQVAFVRAREVLARAEDSPKRQEALHILVERLGLPLGQVHKASRPQ